MDRISGNSIKGRGPTFIMKPAKRQVFEGFAGAFRAAIAA
jgi:hypothetical protein